MDTTTPPSIRDWYTPTDDLVFRRMFTDKQHLEVLAGFIKDFFDYIVDPTEIRILKSESITPATFNGLNAEQRRKFFETRRDVTVEVETADVTIEMQVRPQENYLKRALYYLADVYRDNHTGNADDEYASLKPVWSLSVLDHKVFPDGEPYRTFALRDEVTAQPLEPKYFRVGFFELPKQLKIFGSTEPEINRRYWAELFKTGNAPNGAPSYIRAAADVVKLINADPLERQMIDAREAYLADRRAEQAYALKQAEARGISEGALNKAKRITVHMIRDNVDFATIHAYTDLPIEIIEEIAAAIGQQQ